jgi:hypothetical protein
MSQFKLAYNVQKEIKKLNNTIDLKIIKGLPYKAEARRHKFLMTQFNSFEKQPSFNIFKRTLGLLTSVLL